jgi:D-alanyl-D-alanine dipeptidase
MRSNRLSTVMPALVAGIHVFLAELQKQSVDGRDKPGHDSVENGSI